MQTSSVKSYSALFSCSVNVMYKRVNCSQNKRLMLNSYITGIDSLIGPNIYYNIFFENILNELPDWIEKQSHVIPSPNVSDSIFVKVNGIIFKNRKTHASNIST